MKDVKNEELNGISHEVPGREGSGADIPFDDLPDGCGEGPYMQKDYSGDERRSADRRGSHRRMHDSELVAVIEGLRAELSTKDGEIASLKDVMLRRQADFENYKKRMLKTQDEQKKLSIRNIAHDIIGINDDLLRAIEASVNVQEGTSIDDAHKSFVDGVSMISHRIEETLENYGVVEIESNNMEFDPRLHEAVEFDTSADVKSDTVTKVYLKGFRIDDLVIRTAKVRVTKPAPERAADGDGGSCGE